MLSSSTRISLCNLIYNQNQPEGQITSTSFLHYHSHTLWTLTCCLLLVFTTLASRGFSVAAAAVWNSLPAGIRDSSSTHTFHRLLKTHSFQQAFGSPYRLTQVLRFGHWLTPCTLNIHLLTYIFTAYLTDEVSMCTLHRLRNMAYWFFSITGSSTECVKLQEFQTRCQQRILGIKWNEFITNAEADHKTS